MTPHGFGLRAAALVLAAGAAAAAMVCAQPARSLAQAGPIKIAVFDFELNDTSGGSGIVPQDAIDSGSSGMRRSRSIPRSSPRTSAT